MSEVSVHLLSQLPRISAVGVEAAAGLYSSALLEMSRFGIVLSTGTSRLNNHNSRVMILGSTFQPRDRDARILYNKTVLKDIKSRHIVVQLFSRGILIPDYLSVPSSRETLAGRNRAVLRWCLC